jgi:hypothetical protein
MDRTGLSTNSVQFVCSTLVKSSKLVERFNGRLHYYALAVKVPDWIEPQTPMYRIFKELDNLPLTYPWMHISQIVGRTGLSDTTVRRNLDWLVETQRVGKTS